MTESRGSSGSLSLDHAVTAHDQCAGEQQGYGLPLAVAIRLHCVCRIRDDFVDWNRLPREHRFIDGQDVAADQHAIQRHAFPFRHQHNVSRHQVACCDPALDTTTDDAGKGFGKRL